ncbi:MAG: periplasmic heavy metal sensor [Pseudomonadota bacterium]
MRLGPVLRVLFVVVACISLLANAVIFGVAMRAYSSGVMPRAGAGSVGFELEPRERRAVLMRLRAERPTLRVFRRELQDRRAAMVAALTATPPDPEEIRQRMAEVREATAALQAAVQEVVLDVVIESDRP